MDVLLNNERDESDDYYVILGCDELSNKDQIQTEYRIRALQFHPDKNLDDPKAMERFKQLQEAKEVLCNDVQRKTYDYWRNSHINVPWKKWQSITERSQPTFHWMVTKKEPMIESEQMNKQNEEEKQNIPKTSKWQSTEPTNDYLRKFRNYEI
ncbi:hypothetical protein I4U23_010279 [Adineta vaga]|nr:hypothetical protein I4U23_010279 [Adineta vaga]